jgi:hypothetical protein
MTWLLGLEADFESDLNISLIRDQARVAKGWKASIATIGGMFLSYPKCS